MRKKIFFVLFVCSLFFCSDFAFCAYRPKTRIDAYLSHISLTETKSGIRHINCIYVINLDKRPEKLAQIKDQFLKEHLFLNRVRGVEGWLLTQEQKQELAGSYPVRMRGGEYGCLLSHVSVYKDSFKRKFSRVWILEDDAQIALDVKKIPSLLKKLSTIDPKWDIFYTDSDWRADDGSYRAPQEISCRPHQHKKPLKHYSKRKKVSSKIMRIYSRWGTHSYIVSRRGLKKLVKYFSQNYLWSPIDLDIHFVPGIRQYASREDIVTNPRDRSGSDTV